MLSTTTEWVARARTGDRRAWNALYARFQQPVRAVALATGTAESADDLVQETFVRGLERLGDLRSDDAFGPWLFAITRNLAASGHRRRGRFGVLTDLLVWHPRPTAEAREALEAIRALPEAYRELLLMRLVEEMTGPEIAAATGRTPGSVRVSLHRGMKLLRDQLQEGNDV